MGTTQSSERHPSSAGGHASSSYPSAHHHSHNHHHHNSNNSRVEQGVEVRAGVAVRRQIGGGEHGQAAGGGSAGSDWDGRDRYANVGWGFLKMDFLKNLKSEKLLKTPGPGPTPPLTLPTNQSTQFRAPPTASTWPKRCNRDWPGSASPTHSVPTSPPPPQPPPMAASATATLQLRVLHQPPPRLPHSRPRVEEHSGCASAVQWVEAATTTPAVGA